MVGGGGLVDWVGGGLFCLFFFVLVVLVCFWGVLGG